MNEEHSYSNYVIVSEPSTEDLRPTLEQIAEQKELLDWEKKEQGSNLGCWRALHL